MDPSRRARSRAERLIAIPSVSPDVFAETRCAGALVEELPAWLERGAWWTPDGRPVVWALLPGGSPRTLVLLGHYDTVGVAEYSALGGALGRGIAYDAGALRERLLELERVEGALPGDLRADLEEERACPGTWLFGRGSLDMKGGLAAGIAAIESLAAQGPLPGSVLFLATPDEEHQSSGMIQAVRELPAFRAARRLELAGVINLDYGESPAAYRGVVGKLEVGCYVLGESAHVGAGTRGLDAIQIAATLVAAVTRSADLADRRDGVTTPPPAVLGLRDLKETYSVQTPHEAIAEFSTMSLGRSAAETLEAFRAAIARAFGGVAPLVLTWPELCERAGEPPPPDAAAARDHAAPAGAPDARAATLDRLRRLCARARVPRPAVVLHLLPPYYPCAAPRAAALSNALAATLEGEPDVATRDFYPYISDASYVAWRADSTAALARHLPSLGREYFLPAAEAAELDLEVVNLGPWGRDAHGRFERVHAPYAFERLPRMLARLVRTALESS